MVFAGRPPLVAICECLCFCCVVGAMCMVCFDWFIRQASISCYMHSLFDLFSFSVLYGCFFDRFSSQALVACTLFPLSMRHAFSFWLVVQPGHNFLLCAFWLRFLRFQSYLHGVFDFSVRPHRSAICMFSFFVFRGFDAIRADFLLTCL